MNPGHPADTRWLAYHMGLNLSVASGISKMG